MIADVTAPRFATRSASCSARRLPARGTGQGPSAVVGRFHNVYGPRMGADHVIPEMSLRAMRGEDPFIVWGADQYRAFCYVDDAVEAMLRLMGTPGGGRRDRAHRRRHRGDQHRRPGEAGAPRGRRAARPSGPAGAGRSVARRCPDLAKLRRSPATSRGRPEDGVRRTFDVVPGRRRRCRDRGRSRSTTATGSSTGWSVTAGWSCNPTSTHPTSWPSSAGRASSRSGTCPFPRTRGRRRPGSGPIATPTGAAASSTSGTRAGSST